MKAIQKILIGLFLTIIVVISLVPFIWVLFLHSKPIVKSCLQGWDFLLGCIFQIM
ncbi:hypothetical protein CIY_02130 [Butyrivibrio fibrisolvens 16/4]|nr:hypothetical protein CIY_02130 [Butyrivibrio fibrisolvens 16/4]